MTAVAVVVLQLAACIGLGAGALRLLGVLSRLPVAERIPWAFATGLGILGWLMFPVGVLGLLDDAFLLALLIVGAGSLVFLGRPIEVISDERLDGLGRILVALVLLVAVYEVLEGLSPPADADSAAYHFDLPKRFLALGRIVFVPRAVDGAVPLLVQLTYLPVLELGGERGLTLWTMASGWGLAVLFYTLCRRHLAVKGSLAATLVLLTTPAVIYGAGSGQVEVRMALFATAAAFATASALRSGSLRHALLAGLLAGFYMGSKYLGLLFVLACGITLLVGRGWLARGAVFGAASLLAGFQWYGWNWLHTGDPLFPLLFDWLDYGGRGFWDAAHHANLRTSFFEAEQSLPRSPLWFALYPFVATLGGPAVIESARTGLGPFGLVTVPFVVGGLWRFRRRLKDHPLTAVGAVLILFYGLWFFIGSSQRVRHLLPVFPLFVLCASVAATRWAAARGQKRVLGAAVAATLVVQLAGQTVFSVSYARHVLSGESREDFLRRQIGLYPIVPWINATLSATRDRILVNDREILYFIDIPIYLAHPAHQALIDVLPMARDPARFLHQIRDLGITHILYRHPPQGVPEPTSGFYGLTRAIVRRGCAEVVKSATAHRFASRTLPSLLTDTHRAEVLRLKTGNCLG